jgi:hypothetical protein
MRGSARALLAAALLVIAGTLNIIYGIAGISNAHFYSASGQHYVLSGVKTWGWITLIIGIIELFAGFSLFRGGLYGRIIGITAASIGAIAALLSIGGAYPFWAVGIFALCVIVIHGLIVYGEPERPGQPG